jgi:hypothetical protein
MRDNEVAKAVDVEEALSAYQYYNKCIACDPAKWLLDQVYQFVKLAIDEQTAEVFSHHQICGRSLFFLTQADMTFIMKLELDQAVKVANTLAEMRKEITDMSKLYKCYYNGSCSNQYSRFN